MRQQSIGSVRTRYGIHVDVDWAMGHGDDIEVVVNITTNDKSGVATRVLIDGEEAS